MNRPEHEKANKLAVAWFRQSGLPEADLIRATGLWLEGYHSRDKEVIYLEKKITEWLNDYDWAHKVKRK